MYKENEPFLDKELEILPNESIWQKKPILTFFLVFGISFLLTYFILIIGLLLTGGGLDALTEVMLDKNPDPSSIQWMKFIQCFSVMGFMIVPGFIYSKLMSNSFFNFLKLNSSSLLNYVLAFLMLICIMPFVGWIGIWNEGISMPSFLADIEDWMRTMEATAKDQTMLFLKMNSIGDLIINIIMVGVFAAVGEEILFRGVLQNIFHKIFKNPWVSIILAGFIFSFIHLQFYGFFPRWILGIMLGATYYYSKSLWVPIFIHFFNNAFQVVLVYLFDKKMTEIDINESQAIPFYVALISLGLTIFIGYYWSKNSDWGKDENKDLIEQE